MATGDKLVNLEVLKVTVQKEVVGLKSAVSQKAWDIGSFNRFNPDTAISGVITKYGTIVSNDEWKISDYIPVTPGEVIYASYSLISATNFAMYDSDKSVVANSTNWSNPFTVPNNVYFIRLTVSGTNTSNVYLSPINSFDAFMRITPYMHDKISNLDVFQTATETALPIMETNIETNAEKLEQLSADLTDVYRNGNLIDITKLTENKYVNGAVDGTLASANGFYATDYIPVTEGKQYYSNQNYVFRGYAAFYDANKSYISGYGNTSETFWSNPVTAPSGAAYVRFTILSANIQNAWVSEANRMATKPEDYSTAINKREQYISSNPAEYQGNEILVFKKILCIGDSLTDGFFNESGGSKLVMRNRAYPAKLQQLTGVECTNLGESGFTSVQWYTAHGSDDLSGYDACIIQLGVNDQLSSVSENDMDSAIASIISKVKADNTGIKIFVATITPANSYMTTAMRTRSQMIRDFVAGLNDTDVYLVDLWTYGHTDDYLAYDAGHLSALGYLKLAEDYKAYISYIINTKPDDFRYVQFIGTEYTYSADTTVREITY